MNKYKCKCGGEPIVSFDTAITPLTFYCWCDKCKSQLPLPIVKLSWCEKLKFKIRRFGRCERLI